MTETKDKPNITALVTSLGVRPKRIESILNKVQIPDGMANLNKREVLGLFVDEYPFSGGRIFDALYEAEVLKRGLGSGHGGSGDEIVTVDWDSWYAAYATKQQP